MAAVVTSCKLQCSSHLPSSPRPRPPPASKSSSWGRGAGRRLASASASALLAAAAAAVSGLAVATSAQALPFESFAALPEPANALSLPTWAIHVSSVAEWVTAMVLVWEYGEKSGFPAWKGLSWGMVPPLGGALCACTWHFFYNAESLEILVALQSGLTVIGNITMCIAAYRIFKASQEISKSS